MDTDQYRAASGAALVGGSTVTVLGFTAAEAQYPGYSTADQTISALGAAAAPPESQAVFNAAMVLAGVLLLGATYALQRADSHRARTAVFAVTAVGVAGVGLFPTQTGAPHYVSAMLAFGGVGVAALVVAGSTRGAFRAVSAVLGGVELLALVLFVTLQGGTPLGVGGLERWVAYLGLLWVATYGGFVLAAGSEPA